MPFALLYLTDSEGRATLAGTAGPHIGPDKIDLDDESAVWPLAAVARTGRAQHIGDVAERLGEVQGRAWPEPVTSVLIMPVFDSSQARTTGFLVTGVNPRHALDERYQSFLESIAGQIATALAKARAYEEEKKRAEALAELDRAKTTFFSNVSHEFRTPLTLMLGPIEEILEKPQREGFAENRELLTIAHRNGLRLQKLVNTLLDFSRIEAGRIQAAYELVDLGAFTAELASTFRAAIEKAGMRLVTDCPALPEPVFVDRDMWEKIVLNLVSNAFKYTLAGEIRVALRAENRAAVLTVEDTGIGIPDAEVPNLFKRFHRVEGARGRTQEGTGIGLALVSELAKLHGGSVGVRSVLGKGSVFTVQVPFGKDHLPPERVGSARTLASTALGADPFVEEALRWLPGRSLEDIEGFSKPDTPLFPRRVEAHARARIVLADDNSDMRDYVRRLLSSDYEVTAVQDGEEALRAIDEHDPDLIIADVMMPKLDGFGLLKALRSGARTIAVPVILVSARAGEEAKIEGVQAGADEYITKPFSARELLARVSGTLALSKLRREANAALRESEERFRHMADNSPLMLWVADEHAHCVLLNRRWYEFTGQTEDSAPRFGVARCSAPR